MAARGARATERSDAAHRRAHEPAENDPEGQARNAAFLQGLQQLGWTDGRNVRIEYRWTLGDADRIRKYVTELVALTPDVILAAGAATMGFLLQATRTVPIVFVNLADPVGAGYVDSLSRPGGNAICRNPGSGAAAGVEVTPVNVREPKEIERDIAAFARWSNGGMIVTGSAWANGSTSKPAG